MLTTAAASLGEIMLETFKTLKSFLSSSILRIRCKYNRLNRLRRCTSFVFFLPFVLLSLTKAPEMPQIGLARVPELAAIVFVVVPLSRQPLNLSFEFFSSEFPHVVGRCFYEGGVILCALLRVWAPVVAPLFSSFFLLPAVHGYLCFLIFQSINGSASSARFLGCLIFCALRLLHCAICVLFLYLS